MKTRLILFIIINLFSFPLFMQLQANTDRFYTSVKQLSNSHVNKIYQDKEGLIWICTDNGLNVFDGSNFRTFHNDLNDSTSLMNNSVLTILEDSKGTLWIGTTSGLQCYDRKQEKFRNVRFSYPHATDFSYVNCIIEDSEGNIWISTNRAGAICINNETQEPVYYMKTNSNICSNKINVIYEDRFQNIWIGSQDNGLSVLNRYNQTITNYSYDPGNSHSISSNSVFSIDETPEGNILIGTIDQGINMFNYSTHRFTRKYIPTVDNIFTMCNDSRGNLWIGTDGWGLKCYNHATKSIITYEPTLEDLDLRKAKAHSIMEDTHGNIWVALYQKGVLMISLNNDVFNNIGHRYFDLKSNIGTECILSVIEDHKGDIWIGTDGDGIYRLDIDRKVKQHYQKNRLPGNCALTIFEDSKKRIWVGTYLHGLFLYDSHRDRFEKRKVEIDGNEVSHINTIEEDSEANLWLGTNNNGLCIYNDSESDFQYFQYDLLKNSNQILGNTVHAILFGDNDLVWIGTSINGLSCYDRSIHTFTDYTVANNKLNNNSIYAIAQDIHGNIWVGTKAGLSFIDVKTQTSTFYTEADGLANSSVYGIEIDENNNLWLSTGKGLSNFDIATKRFRNYYADDGLINDEFKRGAHFQSASGELFFGGISGITSFFPFEREITHPLLNLIFTNLFFYNEEIKINEGEKPVLLKNIHYSDRIELDYSIKSFTIGFVGVEYNNPNNVIYQIKMDGFESEWKSIPNNNRYVTYTNLIPGKYKFTVRAFLPGTSYKEKSIDVIIIPPLWQTWWAKIFYLIITISILYFSYCRIRSRIKQKQEDLQRVNENQGMQSKLQFFTDVSHEIRTPLTLIVTPIEHLLKEVKDDKLRETYKIISQNGQRILMLINQVMDMRELDKGQMRLKAEKTDVKKFIKNIIASFDYLTEEKNIHFSFETKENIPIVWMDQEKLDKVIFNVLSNAFKYTPKQGKITIKVDTTVSDLQISISNTGTAIPKEFREVIFDRFYQMPGENNKNKIGTGIGLHLSRSLMEIHRGNIFVADSNAGTMFVITIPLEGDYLTPEEKLEESPDRNVATIVQPSLILEAEHEDFVPLDSNRMKNKHKLLIVEDDKSIRRYIAQILSDEYLVIEAENGKLGLEIAIRETPDCIITDLLMEEMDGLELCKKIKSNEKTCHIPLIMLTARTTIEQRVEGLQVGADSYIPKPFNIEHLRVRIRKLIEIRTVMRNKFEGKYEIDSKEVNVESLDEKFLARVEEYVKKEMANPDLSVETISKEIGISRSQLHRRLKQLTMQRPSEYIKITRLRYASWLLTTKNMSISEVTYATGFSSLSHFSNSFKRFYGMPPSQYTEINRKIDVEDSI